MHSCETTNYTDILYFYFMYFLKIKMQSKYINYKYKAFFPKYSYRSAVQ